MAKFYGRMQKTATRLITKFGKKMQLERQSEPVIDPITGDCSSLPPILIEVVGVVQEYKLAEIEHLQAEIDGSLIQRGDKKVTLTAAAAPLVGDLLVDGSSRYRVLDVEEKRPADVTLVYTVQARGL